LRSPKTQRPVLYCLRATHTGVALLNFRMIASSVQTTDELVSQLQG